MVKLTSFLATAAATTTAIVVRITPASCFSGSKISSISSSTLKMEAGGGDGDWESSSSSKPDEPSSVSSSLPPPPPPPVNAKIRMSEAIPFLRSPAYLNGELAGDVGFDPLGFGGKDRDSLMEMREAEIKHARLAMLAAVGWPFAELFDRQIADYFGLPTILDATDRVQFDRIVPEWWGFCLGLTAAIDLYGLRKKRSGDPDYFPGNLGFDPLGLYPESDEKRRNVQTAEIKHGRLAMIAVAGYAAQEGASNVGVVDEFLSLGVVGN